MEMQESQADFHAWTRRDFEVQRTFGFGNTRPCSSSKSKASLGYIVENVDEDDALLWLSVPF